MNVISFLNPFFVLLLLHTVAETSVLTDFQQKLGSGSVFEATLIIQEKAAEAREPARYDGKVWLAGTGYRLEMNDRIYLVSGSESRVFELEEKRLIISPYDVADDDFAPAKYLTGQPAGYSVQESKSKKGVLVRFKALEGGLPYSDVEVQFDPQGMPQKLIAKDEFGGKVSVDFKNTRFSTTGKWNELIVPADAELIDLRQ